MSWIPNKWQRLVLGLTTLALILVFFNEVGKHSGPNAVNSVLLLLGAAGAACLALHKVGGK